MLSKPEAGWSKFSLNGTSTFSLSYIEDIAFYWIEQAMDALKYHKPFCVEGVMEPGSILVVVSYYWSFVISEDDNGNWVLEESDITLIDFCKELYSDILPYVDEWANFTNYFNEDREKFTAMLSKLLDEFHEVIVSAEK